MPSIKRSNNSDDVRNQSELFNLVLQGRCPGIEISDITYPKGKITIVYKEVRNTESEIII